MSGTGVVLDELGTLLRRIEGMSAHDALEQESLAYARLQVSDPHNKWLKARASVATKLAGQVLLERCGDQLDITLDRPDALNALDVSLRDGLREAFELAALDPDIAVVNLRGAGKAFCIGGDLGEFGTTRNPEEAHMIRMATLPAFAIAACADRLSVHIQGACIGAGLEMAAFAKSISATSNAWFQLPELAMGLIPGAGGCVSIPKRIGVDRFLSLFSSGKRISANTALDWGLIDTVMDD